MAYEYFYQGNKYGLESGSDSLYTGAQVQSGALGGTTSIQTANQVQEVSNLLNTGMKTIEVSAIQQEVFDMIPKQHLKEINRLSKLTGSDITFHGPVVEPSGFTDRGWSEQNRESAERQMADAAIRAQAMHPQGGMPATFHASQIPGTEIMPVDSVPGLTEEEKIKYKEGVPVKMLIMNQETGELGALRREEMYDPEEGKKIFTPEAQLRSRNQNEWIDKLTQMEFYRNQVGEAIEKGSEGSDLFLGNVEKSFVSMFDRAARYGKPEVKKKLNEISENWKKFAKEAKEKFTPREMMIAKSELLGESIHKLYELGAKGQAPEIYQPLENFALDKSSETFSNVALTAYKKLGNKAPIISIENPPYGAAFSTAEDLRDLIKESRNKFMKKAINQGMSKSEAKRAAESMIGATWDTSHISMIRKQGFGEKKLIEEAKKIAPFVKHVHLNDNFGYSHTDLPPGMGTVPFKEIMGELKKKGYKGKHILEGGNFFQHFKTSPHAAVLEAMGSPIYAMQAQPSWSQVYGTMGTYSSGYGSFLPEMHSATYGIGWSGLPSELGGGGAGRQSKFSGAPNA